MSDDMIQPERPDPTDISRQPRRLDDRPPLDDRGDLPRLGSLAETARNKHLKQARTTLLVVGILMAIFAVVGYFYEMDQLHKMGAVFIGDEIELLLMSYYGGTAALGIIFIV